MLRSTGVLLGRSKTIARLWKEKGGGHKHYPRYVQIRAHRTRTHTYTHTHRRGLNPRNGKSSTGPYGNAFAMYLGLNIPKRVLLHNQKVLDRAEEAYAERVEIDEFARDTMRPEWHEVQDRDPFSPTPLVLRRFMWEAKQRRHFYDRRNPFVEQLCEEEYEDKASASFRAFPGERAQEVRVFTLSLPLYRAVVSLFAMRPPTHHTTHRQTQRAYPERYTEVTAADMQREFSEEDIDRISKPADTYYSKRDTKQ